MSRARDVIVGVCATALVLGAGAVIGAGGWPGAPSECIAAGDCYCETLGGGLAAQPVNTFSNLAFVAAGLWVLAVATTGGANRMTTRLVYPRLYAAASIAIGAGSMLFHGAMTAWGGWFDLMGMHLFITFLLLYDLALLRNRSTQWFVRTYVVLNFAVGVLLAVIHQGYGKFVFGALVVGVLWLEYLLARRPRIERNRRWLYRALATYGAGQVIWLLSRDGAPLCHPDSLFQGHAVWHLTGAITIGLLYHYLRTGREPALEERPAVTG